MLDILESPEQWFRALLLYLDVSLTAVYETKILNPVNPLQTQ